MNKPSDTTSAEAIALFHMMEVREQNALISLLRFLVSAHKGEPSRLGSTAQKAQ